MAGSSLGEILREARIEQGRTIAEAARETRIPAHFIDSLEREHFGDLPAPVYTRGFLRSYANFLDLNAQVLVEEVMRMAPEQAVGVDAPLAETPPLPEAPLAPRKPTADPFRRSSPRTPPPAPLLIEDPSVAHELDSDVAVAPTEDAANSQNADGDDEYIEPTPVAGEAAVLSARDREWIPRGLGALAATAGKGARGTRLMALAGGIAIVAIVVVAVVALTNGGGGTDNQVVAGNVATSTPGSSNVVAAASATPAASQTTATETVTPTSTAAPATPADAQAVLPATPTPATTVVATTPAQPPTVVPTARPASIEPAATPTSPPPTPTPAPPTATPSPAPIPPTATPTSPPPTPTMTGPTPPRRNHALQTPTPYSR